MYQEDAEALEHERELVAQQLERAQHGTGMPAPAAEWLPGTLEIRAATEISGGGLKITATVDGEPFATAVRLPGTVTRIYWSSDARQTSDCQTLEEARKIIRRRHELTRGDA